MKNFWKKNENNENNGRKMKIMKIMKLMMTDKMTIQLPGIDIMNDWIQHT